MKRIFVLGICLFASLLSFGQAADLEAISELLGKNDIEGARKIIDKVFEKTPKDPRAYLLKGAIYQSLVENEKTASSVPDGAKVAFEAYKTYMSMDKKYQVEQIRPNLFNLVVLNYNKAINYYNDAKYSDAISSFESIKDIAGVEGGKIFASDKLMDTISAQCKMYTGYSYFNDKKYNEAQSVFESIAENPIVKDKDIYLRLSNIYQTNNDNAKWKEVLDKADRAYPGDKDILYDMINYYLVTNNSEELIKKLEQAIDKDPKNAELHFNLGATAESLMKKADASQTPALMDKATKAYEQAIALDPNNGDYAYNLGALNWNQAVPIAEKMNTVLKDPKKYDEYKKQLLAVYAKAAPYFEKAMTAYEKGGVKPANKANYRNVLVQLQKIYGEINKPAKEAITKKLGSLE